MAVIFKKLQNLLILYIALKSLALPVQCTLYRNDCINCTQADIQYGIGNRVEPSPPSPVLEDLPWIL